MNPISVTRDTRGKLDLTKLLAQIKEVKTQMPDQSVITLQTEDSVRYEDLVRIIDECNGSGLQNVSVSAAMG
jgi:biopolymer transport protein ExbD